MDSNDGQKTQGGVFALTRQRTEVNPNVVASNTFFLFLIVLLEGLVLPLIELLHGFNKGF